MSNGRSIVSAFVGRGFNKKDKLLWQVISEHLNSLRNIGFSWEDAEEAQGKSVSAKVKEKIRNNDIFIGILTKREPIYESRKYQLFHKPFNWLTSYWVIQESGYAIGLGKKVIFVKEKGLDVPDALNADSEYIEIDLADPQQAITKLTSIITIEMRTRISITQSEYEVISNVQKLPQVKQESGLNIDSIEQIQSDIIGKFEEIDAVVKGKDYLSAERIYKEILETEQFNTLFEQKKFARGIIGALYYSRLYKSGKNEAINNIRKIVDEDPKNLNAMKRLIECYEFYDRYDEARKEIENRISYIEDYSTELDLSVLLSDINIRRGDYEQAKSCLSAFFDNLNSNTGDQNYEIYKALANVYKKEGRLDMSCFLFEMALNYNPHDTGIRFSLAYDYDQIKKHKLSVYHYEMHLKINEDSGVLNNLGVEYLQLGIKGKCVNLYKRGIQHGNTLSSANLADLYISAGFYDEAKNILNQAISIEDHHRHVDSNMEDIKSKLEEESKKEKSVLDDAKKQRDYVLDYAKAISIPFRDYDKIKGLWSFSYSKLNNFKIDNISHNVMEGVYEYEYKGRDTLYKEEQKIMSIRFAGNLINSGFEYTLKITSRSKDSSYERNEQPDINGLGIISISDDKVEINLVAEKDGEYEFFTATKELTKKIS